MNDTTSSSLVNTLNCNLVCLGSSSFIAGLNSSIELLDDGSVKVTLKGADKEYIITQEELNRKDEYSTGDMDVRALEIAMEKHFEKDGYRVKLVNNFDTIEQGGLSSMAFKVLTGKDDSSFFEGTLYELLFDKLGLVTNNSFLKKVKDPNIACTASISFGERSAKTRDGNEVILADHHVYSVLNADDEYVYVENPWDTSETIVMTIDEFKKTFDSVGLVDLN